MEASLGEYSKWFKHRLNFDVIGVLCWLGIRMGAWIILTNTISFSKAYKGTR